MTPPVVADASAVVVGGFLSRNVAATSTAGMDGGLTRTESHGEENQRSRGQQRRASAAEKYLEQFRQVTQTQVQAPVPQTAGNAAASILAAVRTSPQRERIRRYSRGSTIGTDGVVGVGGIGGPPSRRQSLIQPANSTGALSSGIPEIDNVMGGLNVGPRPRLERPPSAPGLMHPQHVPTHRERDAAGVGSPAPPPMSSVMAQLRDLLDGTRHTDELGVRFGLGWPALEKHLVAIGGGKGDGDFGRVEIIYR